MEGIPVRAKGAWHIEYRGIDKGLMNAITHSVVIVLGFDNRDGGA